MELENVYRRLGEDLVLGAITYYTHIESVGGVDRSDYFDFLYRIQRNFNNIVLDVIHNLDQIVDKAAVNRSGIVVEAALFTWKKTLGR